MAYGDSFGLQAAQNNAINNPRNPEDIFPSLRADGVKGRTKETSAIDTTHNTIPEQNTKTNTYNIPREKIDEYIKILGNKERNYFQGQPKIDSPFFRR